MQFFLRFGAIHIVGEWVCSARMAWVVLSCAGVWPGAPCGMAAERCVRLHAATSPCGGRSSLEHSLQTTCTNKRVLPAVCWLPGGMELIGALSLANWCLIVFACVVDIGGLAGVSSLGGTGLR